jgi:HK97 family phage portal protein
MFINRSIGAAHLDPNNDALFTGLGGYTSAAGQVVSPETAMRLTVVFACVRTIAEAIGQLPLHVFQRQGRKKEFAIKHPLYRLLHRKPNAWQTSAEWRETVAAHLVLRGNAYNEIITAPNGTIQALIPIHPDYMRPVADRDRSFIRYHVKQSDGTERPLLPGQVLHLRGMAPDGFIGLNPIEQEREAIGYALAAQDYGARFYRNGATMPGWIEHSSNFKTQDDRDRFKYQFQTAQAGGNRFKTPVFEYGMKYHELALKHTDMQYLESRKHSDIDIARIFRVPPHKVGLLDRATWSNIEQQSLEFVTDTLTPWLVKMEQSFERDLLADDEQDIFFCKFNLNSLLRGDAAARSRYYGSGIRDGWLVRNEVRALEDMDALDGLDEPLSPLNMAPVGSLPDNAGEGTDNQKPGRAQRMAHAAAMRIVNKECIALRRAYEKSVGSKTGPAEFRAAVERFYATHADLVSELMACDPRHAERYVAASCDEVLKALALESSTGIPAINDLLSAWETNKAPRLAHIETFE